MAKVFLFNAAKCTGCYNCQLACKDEHVGNDWTPYAAAQPKTGQFWCKVNERTCGTIPKVKVFYLPTLCNHCKNPACVKAAKDGAVYQREDGLVIIDPVKAKGQKQIVDSCPYGAIYWNEEMQLPQKCTGCAHLLDGGAKLPRCVEACPTDALRFGEEEEFQEELKGAEALHPEYGLSPRVHYRNLPGQFIAATVYDPVEKEVIIGAKCHLAEEAKTWDTVTDDFGDFWFKDLPVSTFTLILSAPGYERKTISGIRTEECVNLGDIALEKKQ